MKCLPTRLIDDLADRTPILRAFQPSGLPRLRAIFSSSFPVASSRDRAWRRAGRPARDCGGRSAAGPDFGVGDLGEVLGRRTATSAAARLHRPAPRLGGAQGGKPGQPPAAPGAGDPHLGDRTAVAGHDDPSPRSCRVPGDEFPERAGRRYCPRIPGPRPGGPGAVAMPHSICYASPVPRIPERRQRAAMPFQPRRRQNRTMPEPPPARWRAASSFRCVLPGKQPVHRRILPHRCPHSPRPGRFPAWSARQRMVASLEEGGPNPGPTRPVRRSRTERSGPSRS